MVNKGETIRGVADDDRWALADPGHAVGLLGTLRRRGDALAGDDLPEDPEAVAWVREHAGVDSGVDCAELVGLRELMRQLFTAVVDGQAPPDGTIAALDDLAARSPVNLAGHLAADRTVVVERTSPGTTHTVLRADLARSALALLVSPARDRLRLCQAPGCSLFFLTDRPRRLWCSTDCGNRARVARHYTRHNQRR
jgi:predicted RNA-binding Zn ribbon-like protein